MHRRGKGLKAELDRAAEDESESMYGVYSLKDIPKKAWPDKSKPNQGTHSYTISDGEAKIEILLRNRAFFVKKFREPACGPVGHVAFAKFDGPAGGLA